MKKLKAIVFLTLIAALASACKTAAPATTNTAAKPANTNSAPAAKPTSTAAAKTEVAPVATDNGENVYTHAASGLKFEVPPSWKAEADGDMMTLTSADDLLTTILWVPEEGSLQASLNALDEEFGKMMKHIKRNGPPSQTTLNGMTVYTVDGTGEIDGQSIEWGANLLEARKPVIVLSFGAPGAYDQHKKDVVAFARSLKKV